VADFGLIIPTPGGWLVVELAVGYLELQLPRGDGGGRGARPDDILIYFGGVG
jgi:hypothetical protein